MSSNYGLGLDPSTFGIDSGQPQQPQRSPQLMAFDDFQKLTQMPDLSTLKVKTETGPEGTKTTVDDEHGVLEHAVQLYQQQAKTLKDVLAGFQSTLGQEQQRLQRREQMAEQNPLVNVLGTVASSMAQAKNMPGWVQGLGHAAQRLNPTVDEIRAKQMAVGERQADLAMKQLSEADRIELAKQRAVVTAEQRAQTTATAKEKIAASKLKEFAKPYEAAAAKTFVQPDQEKFLKSGIAQGVPEELVKAKYDEIVDIAAKSEAKYLEKESRQNEQKHHLFQEREGLAIKLKQMGVEGSERMANAAVSRGMALIDHREESQKRVAEWRSGLVMDRTKDRVFAVPSSGDMKELEQVGITRKYVEDVTRVLNDPATSQYFGPIRLSRLSESDWFKALRSDEQQAVMTLLTHERPRVVALSGAGARGYSKTEWPVIKELGGDPTYTPSQMAQVLKVMQKSNADRALSVMQLRHKANWDDPSIRKLVGDETVDEWKAGKIDPKRIEKMDASADGKPPAEKKRASWQDYQ